MRNEAGHLSPQASGHMHLTIISAVSERVEPLQQFHLAFPSRRFGGPCGKGYLFQSLTFGLQTGPRIDICRIEARVSEPVTNHRYVNTCSDKAHRGSVPKLVRGDSLAGEGGHLPGCGSHILL